MSEQPDAGEKSFDPTPDRLKKARREGNVPLSPELTTFGAYIGALVATLFAGGGLYALADTIDLAFRVPEGVAAGLFGKEGGVSGYEQALLRSVLGAIALCLLPSAVLVIALLILQQAIVFAPKRIKPDLKRIAPWEGIKRKYGQAGMSEFAKSAAKLIAVTTLGGIFLWGRRDAYAAMVALPVGTTFSLFVNELIAVLLIAAAIAAAVSIIDVPARFMGHTKRLRMTRQEVTDENKEMEGDPALKQSRRRRAEEISNNRMLIDTQDADVVIVNPTHYAVALKWDRSEESVPVCVAKGLDNFALAIIDRARLSGVPVREDPPCARALHATVDVGERIKSEHYVAVAAAIRFAESVRQAR